MRRNAGGNIIEMGCTKNVVKIVVEHHKILATVQKINKEVASHAATIIDELASISFVGSAVPAGEFVASEWDTVLHCAFIRIVHYTDERCACQAGSCAAFIACMSVHLGVGDRRDERLDTVPPGAFES